MISLKSYNTSTGLSALYLVFSLIFLISVSNSAVEIPKKVCTNGSVKSNSVSLYVKGAIGQPVIQKCNSVSIYLKSGLMQSYMAIDNTQCHPGDANNDAYFNILDVVYLINFKYKSGPAPVPDEICSGDSNCDCELNILDAVLLINFIYKSDLPPCDYTGWRVACP